MNQINKNASLPYGEVESSANFSKIEKDILKFWQEEDVFQKSIDIRENSAEFIFYDGPPFANGLPHYGHLLTGFIKDSIARFQTISGKKVARRFGWDCHGLPAEMGAEKELGISGRIAINEYGVDKFNAQCKKSVLQFTDQWEEYVTRQGRWVDFKNSYKTMDKNFMESVLWAFSELYKKGLVYQSMRVMPYSWACETPLSNFETRLDNSYRERADKSVTVLFTLDQNDLNIEETFGNDFADCKEFHLLAWTTTPWTLPSNLAVAVGEEIDYACVKSANKCYIIGKFALNSYAKELGIVEGQEFKIIKGSALAGLKYQPVFDYFKNNQNSFKVLTAEFVEEGDGTGIVHIAPGFGEDDQILCAKYDIELVCPVDNSGKFTSEVPDFVGVQVFDANDPIIIKLKQMGKWFKTEQYIHNYPHCWRTDTPLIYKAVPSWYVKVSEFKDRMVQLNQEINWIPGNIKDGLFGKWLENARDWSISRNRFWGTPIPIWQSDDPKYPRIDVYGSIAEIEADFGVEVPDLHKPFIDNLTRPNPDDPTGKSTMRRVEDVFDCWFESGSMPYGQAHYPFENKEWFETHFPADFIVEYTAQTRGWFYTLMVLSTALFDRPPFLNCICHGVILDDKGQKLSKRLQNYANPLDTFDKYGSDALRATMMSSSVTRGQELLIDKEGKMVFDSLRLIIKPIWNSFHFFCLYANADRVTAKINYNVSNQLDLYILSKLKTACNKIKISLNDFDCQTAYNAITEFFEILNNWYIRRSRARFWQSEKNQDKIEAYDTLYACLHNISIAMSPLLPFISEYIFKKINVDESVVSDLNISKLGSVSVHLQDFPQLDRINDHQDLVENMDIIQGICSSALFVRNQHNIRVRQPLASAEIIATNAEIYRQFEDIIKDEINVKQVIYNTDLAKYSDQILSIKFPILGKRLPGLMKDIIKASKLGHWQLQDKNLIICDQVLLPTEYELVLKPKGKEGASSFGNMHGLVSIDLNISDDLKNEGLARDIIRFIQQSRRDLGFDISDILQLKLTADGELKDVSLQFQKFIESQTLCHFIDNMDNGKNCDVDIDGQKLTISLKR